MLNLKYTGNKNIGLLWLKLGGALLHHLSGFCFNLSRPFRGTLGEYIVKITDLEKGFFQKGTVSQRTEK